MMGTATDPSATLSVTVAFGATLVPAAGLMAITVPVAAFEVTNLVTGTRPSFFRARSAAEIDRWTTSGNTTWLFFTTVKYPPTPPATSSTTRSESRTLFVRRRPEERLRTSVRGPANTGTACVRSPGVTIPTAWVASLP